LEAATIGPVKRMRRQLRNIEAMLAQKDRSHVLGTCPHCQDSVIADVHAFRYRLHWYHVRCALVEREQPVGLEASA
jgi:hypothetical protein